MDISSLTVGAVVFDFDGTLAILNIDFGEMRRDILGLASAFGIRDESLEHFFVLEMIAEVRSRIALYCPGREDAFAGEAVRRVTERELAGARHSALFPGIKDMFGELRTRGIKTGILTRNCTEAVRTIFPDILAYSDAVVTRDDTEKVKPHPDHLLAVLSSLREDPERTAMVGDHPMDMILGKRVGAFAVGVLTGYSGADALRGAGADLILKEAAHIMGHLK